MTENPPITTPEGDLLVEDTTVEVHSFSGVIRLGLGAVGYIHPGVVVDVADGAVAHLAPGAHLELEREEQLARGEVTVTRWCPTTAPAPASCLHVVAEKYPATRQRSA